MEKDIKALSEFKARAADCLASVLQIKVNEAENIIRLLESNDILRLQAPEYVDKPATAFTMDKPFRKDDLGMTSHKVGNIIVNIQLDWKKLVSNVISSAEAVEGLYSGNPFLAVVGILSWLVSVSALTDIRIAENGSAIIMALQQHNKHKVYAATEQQCMKEANEILALHGYDEMDDQTFQKEIDILCKIKCIEFFEEKVKLTEKIILPFRV